MAASPLTFVVEHLDPELGRWSSLEYACIARESQARGARFLLSSVSPSLQMPRDLADAPGLEVERRGVEEIFEKPQVCLLDPGAQAELSPADGDQFKVFLFGGILGENGPVCLGVAIWLTRRLVFQVTIPREVSLFALDRIVSH